MLDVRTIQVTSIFLNIILCLMYFLVYLYSERRKFFLLWIWSALILNIAFLGFVLRSPALIRMGIIISHLGIIAWLFLLILGIEQFYSIRLPRRNVFFSITVLIDLAVILLFGSKPEDQIYRATFTGLLLTGGHWYVAWKMYWAPTRTKFRFTIIAIATFILLGAIWFIRWIGLFLMEFDLSLGELLYESITNYLLAPIQILTGFILTALALYRDFEESKQNRENAIVNRRLFGLNSYMSGIAHQVNTPLGNAKLMLSSLGESTETNEKIQAKIDYSLQYIEMAIKSIRVFQNISGESESGWEHRSCEDFMQALLETFSQSGRLHSHQFNWHADQAILYIQTEVITSILLELIENSLSHGYGPGKTPKVQIDFTLHKQPLGQSNIQKITYRDWGTGISPEDYAMIFDPYHSQGKKTGH
jgi:signal transduction histidine kinase